MNAKYEVFFGPLRLVVECERFVRALFVPLDEVVVVVFSEYAVLLWDRLFGMRVDVWLGL
eukprot:scaffold9753_cov160-Amphora_coffeaeformis.AAC.4